MPIPETLSHPFTTAKIVIRPAACSVGNGLIVAARRRDAALCACGRRGERTYNRCDRDNGSKCLPHSRPSYACIVRLGHRRTIMPRNLTVAGHSQRAIVSGQLSALIDPASNWLLRVLTGRPHNRCIRGPSACLKSAKWPNSGENRARRSLTYEN
jgi:hypothetical protein